MAESDALETKLTQLEITVQRTQSILEAGKREAIKRHIDALKTTLRDADQCKRALEAKKIAEKENISTINDWNDEIEAILGEADGKVSLLEKWLDEKEKEAKVCEQEEQFKFELKLHESKLKLQAELVNTKPEVSKSATTTTTTERTAKLPKLVISKFDGSYMDWPRFWGQFTEAIDKSSIAPISKFTYLCELLDPKVKRMVEALPFTVEGYNRAKSILQDRFGKESEIIKSYVKEIMDLPPIPNANPKKISDFSDKLSYCVQALETMKKLDQVAGNVSMTLDKLPGIRGDLVRTDPDWESWSFIKLTEALHQWVRRNPVDKSADKEREENNRKRERNKLLQARGKDYKPKGCVYCEDEGHKATECKKVTDINERKRILIQKGLCFNCATRNHRASDCPSKTSCQHCKRRHHTSLCEQSREGNANNQKLMTDGKSGDAIFPVVVVNVDDYRCRALIDSGAGSSYASAKLIDLLKKKPSETKTQRIDMLMSSKVIRTESYDAVIDSLDSSYQMDARLTKVNKGELLTIDNPRYKELIKRHQHLKRVEILDDDEKQHLPIHVILGSGDYARIKTETKPLVGNDGDPVAERTKLGWFIMSPGAEPDQKTMMMAQTSQSDYESLCRLDVLGLADSPENDQEMVYEDFKEQLGRSSDGWYETNLPWKANHPPLPTNEQGSRRRLEQLVKKLQREGNYDSYNKVIQDQLQQGVIEPAPKDPSEKEFYMPHKGVVKREAESTKLRIVYDASAREANQHPSLNDCLHSGPPLQNLLWSILVKSRFYPVLLTGDLQKAFLQVRIKKEERDALRFLWRPPGHDKTVIYRFTRAVFGLTCSPFLLGGVINRHLKSWEHKYPELAKELRDGIYVDDLMVGGPTVEDVVEKKNQAIEVFEDATFVLHKWHSNVETFEKDDKSQPENEEPTFAKQQLGANPPDTKLLGLVWDKRNDTLGVTMSNDKTVSTKRGALSGLAKIYDPLGLVSPTTLQGKLLYREICDANVAWDGDLTKPLKKRWNNWSTNLPERFTIQRSLAPYLQPVIEVTLHAFGDASKDGVSAIVYAVVQQEQGATQGLVCARSRLAKRNLTIPRLELVAGHMAVNLATNVEAALSVQPEPTIHCWLDSTVALYWINGQGEYRQFVANRVHKIQQHSDVKWHHVPTAENPADLGSRGGSVVNQELWKNGPAWLSDPSKWPQNIVLETSPEAKSEMKVTRSVLTTAVRGQDQFDELLETKTLLKVHRVGAWIQRFIGNCRNPPNNRKSGPIDTREIKQQKIWWIKRTQRDAQTNDNFEGDKLQLNLQPNQDLILECRGRIEGEYPVYLPDNHPYTQKLVRQAHLSMLHGGVTTTMAKVREVYWVPRLRRLVKRIRGECWGCKRFRIQAFQSPPPGILPSTRTQGSTPFEVLGVDFAGPIYYQTKGKSRRKAYLALFGCSLTRAVHLELLKSLEATEFIACLKRFVARRGKPRLIYSDNAKTFKATEKWLKQVQGDERLNALLVDQSIEWRFNLSRAPWWGGQFERLIGLFKAAFYKTIGNGTLRWEELEEVVIDVEMALNNRPLCYLEDDVELPILTPYSMMHINPSYSPELDAHHIEDTNLRRRARFLKRCKEAMWSRWSREYVRNLREQHRRAGGQQTPHPQVGDAVIVQDKSKNRNEWKLAIVTDLITGRDDIVRGARLKTAKGNLERACQHLYPLELSCDITRAKLLDPAVESFVPRASRDAATAAGLRIRQLADNAQEED